jgi:excisionase family DNA binding protein
MLISAQLLTLQELAEALRLPEQWLRQEVEAGRLPHLKVEGPHRQSKYRFSRAAVEAVLLARAAEMKMVDNGP